MSNKAKYTVEVREEGRGRPTVRKFDTLKEVQQYVKDRWCGVDYVDGRSSFHSDYATFDLIGCTLTDLGRRMGPHGTYEFWCWDWLEVEN